MKQLYVRVCKESRGPTLKKVLLIYTISSTRLVQREEAADDMEKPDFLKFLLYFSFLHSVD